MLATTDSDTYHDLACHGLNHPSEPRVTWPKLHECRRNSSPRSAHSRLPLSCDHTDQYRENGKVSKQPGHRVPSRTGSHTSRRPGHASPLLSALPGGRLPRCGRHWVGMRCPAERPGPRDAPGGERIRLGTQRTGQWVQFPCRRATRSLERYDERVSSHSDAGSAREGELASATAKDLQWRGLLTW
jgi:hypothetical protein